TACRLFPEPWVPECLGALARKVLEDRCRVSDVLSGDVPIIDVAKRQEVARVEVGKQPKRLVVVDVPCRRYRSCESTPDPSFSFLRWCFVFPGGPLTLISLIPGAVRAVRLVCPGWVGRGSASTAGPARA